MGAIERQIAVVMDLNKCIGCQTCTIACKIQWTNEDGMQHMFWNTVNTCPGEGTPKGWEDRQVMGGGYRDSKPIVGHMPTHEEWGSSWEFNYDDVLHGGKEGADYFRPKGDEPTWGANWDEEVGGGQYPNSYFFYLPRICNHCTHAACMEACPRSAIYKREEDGIVLISEARCEGYRFCMEACPYKKIYFNHIKKVSQKCVFCFPRVEQGVAPACMRQCPGHVRWVGYRDDAEGPIYKIVDKWEVALPLHPEFGTEPNVFYVPPIIPAAFDEEGRFDVNRLRIPTDYLRYLFGPKVDKALETIKAEMAKTRRGEKSELMDLLIARRWIEQMGPWPRDPADLARPPEQLKMTDLVQIKV